MDRRWMRTTGMTAVAIAAIAVAAGAAETPEAKARQMVVRVDDGDGAERREVVIVRTGEDEGTGALWVGPGEHGFRFQTGPRVGLGVQLTDITPELRAHFGVPEGEGVLIAKVVEGSPAARAGVQVGDVLTRIDGKVVADTGEVIRQLSERKAGELANVEVWRNGRMQTLAATLETLELGAMPGFDHPRVLLEKLRAGELEELEGLEGAHPRIMIRRHGEGGEGDHPRVMMFRHEGLEALCGEGERCELRIECKEGGDCTCTADGEEVACPESVGEK